MLTMTRPKVPDDKRQRTAQACDTCKRRKQKCNGLKPCNTCIKRTLICEYNTPHPSNDYENASHGISAKKRRNIQEPLELVAFAASTGQPAQTSTTLSIPSVTWSSMPTGDSGIFISEQNVPYQPLTRPEITPSPITQRFEPQFRTTAISGPDDEIEVRGDIRWLQDPNGRLLYIGESSPLSFLQVIRTELGIAIESSQTSQFIDDGMRHTLPETRVIAPPSAKIPVPLPEKEVAEALVQSYFTNTHGLVEILDRKSFEKCLNDYYSEPDSVWESNLCLIHLTLASGLVMAIPGQDDTLKPLLTGPVDYADLYFRSGKFLGELVPGYEDGDIWSVQARVLMALYKFLVSKWNAAYEYLGSAVSTACSLGFHRIEEPIFSFEDMQRLSLRRNLWRSLYVLDRIISEFVGRPMAISEDDCSEDTLSPPQINSAGGESAHMMALNAVVQSSQAIGKILRKIYGSRKISIRLGQSLLDECTRRFKALHANFNSSRLFKELLSPAEGVAILYVNVLEMQSILLLTRPYFLHMFILLIQPWKWPADPPRGGSHLERLARACLATAKKAIALIHAAYISDWLPHRNSLIVNFLFSSTMVLLSNELANMCRNDQFAELVDKSMDMIAHSVGPDAQGQRVWSVLGTFRGFVEEYKLGRHSRCTSMANQSTTVLSSPGTSLSGTENENILGSDLKRRNSSTNIHNERRGSRPSVIQPQTRIHTSQGTLGPPPMGGQAGPFKSRRGGQGPFVSTTGSSQRGRSDFDFEPPWDFDPTRTALGQHYTPVSTSGPSAWLSDPEHLHQHFGGQYAPFYNASGEQELAPDENPYPPTFSRP